MDEGGRRMKVGIIGTGNMGTILSEALITGRAISPSDLILVNRTISKAMKLKDKYNDISVASSIKEVILGTDLMFLCVKPKDFYSLLEENKEYFKNNQCLVSITSPIKPQWLEKIVPCSCVRIIPSITNRALSGATLFSFGEQCKDDWKKTLITMLSNVSEPVIIDDEITRVSSDIVSCGPAFYSYITRKFIEAAVTETAIDEKTAVKLFEQMLIGLGDILKKGYYSLPELEEKVTVKGGITGEGISVLEKNLEGVFEKVFYATHQKYFTEMVEIENDFHT